MERAEGIPAKRRWPERESLVLKGGLSVWPRLGTLSEPTPLHAGRAAAPER